MAHTKRMVLSAAYGMGNIGDEAICETIIRDARALYPNLRITILVHDRYRFSVAHKDLIENTSLSICPMEFYTAGSKNLLDVFRYFKGVWNIIVCDVFFWGGGGLVRNRTDWLKRYMKPLLIAQSYKKKIIIGCIGVDAITSPEVRSLLSAIKKPYIFSVRDEESRVNLLSVAPHFSHGDIEVIPDPAFHISDHFPIQNQMTHKGKKIGINVSFWKTQFGDQEKIKLFASSVASTLNTLFETESYTLVYLPTTDKKDDQVFAYIESFLRKDIHIQKPSVQHVEAYLHELTELNLFIGMRLHSLILASSVLALPSIPIMYDEKVIHFCSLMNIKGFSIESIIKSPEEFFQTLQISDKREYITNRQSVYSSSRRICSVLQNTLQ